MIHRKYHTICNDKSALNFTYHKYIIKLLYLEQNRLLIIYCVKCPRDKEIKEK